MNSKGTVVGQQTADDFKVNGANLAGDTHFAGSLQQQTMTVNYIDKVTNKPVLTATTGIKANVGDTVGIDGLTDAKASNILGAPTHLASDINQTGNIYVGTDGKKYKLVSADSLTVSGDSSKNVLNPYFQAQETTTIKYQKYASGSYSDLNGQTLQGVSLKNTDKTGFNADAIDYSDITLSVPGYTTYYIVNGTSTYTLPKNFDASVNTITVVFQANKQTVKTQVTGLPDLSKYATTKSTLTTSNTYETDSKYSITDAAKVQVPGYDLVVTDEAGNVVKNFSDLIVPTTGKTYTYTYTARTDTTAKVYFTYIDMDTGLVKPIDKDAVGLERVNGH